MQQLHPSRRVHEHITHPQPNDADLHAFLFTGAPKYELSPPGLHQVPSR